ncbi:hypothetical protein [Deinococcus ruber]|uniref:Uncharacterized protein n=1 Tax=Deinococcus ruber TaxID=1848197 RepID=A0A918F334_9DEIO|nr:hypothetical protein [Deinococcus ruber]GGR00187.1 hypothetical protein GCM10008957_11150 [Deinococcus ruber]
MKKPILTTPLVWYHGSYLVNLPEQSKEMIRREFEKMLGPVLHVGVIESPEQLQSLYQQISLVNNWRARDARRLGKNWVRAKVIVWRGCYCIRQQPKGPWWSW